MKFCKIKRTKADDGMIRTYKFDKVFDSESSQEHVFRDTNIPFYIQKLIEGYHSSIFAYGQTGSGKTYTMENYDYALPESNNRPIPIINPYSEGIVHKSVHELFHLLSDYKISKGEIRVFVSFLQIYNEKIFDLLNMRNANDITCPLKLRWTKEDQFIVDGLYLGECETEEDAISLYNSGIQNRSVATNKYNIASSRSHTIFTITIQNYQGSNKNNNATYSKLNFVDLAGSERTSINETDDKHLKESIDINKSLLVLRRIILNLAEKRPKKYIPYRESKLTSLLKQSFGGNSYCLMIACLSPSDINFEENISTLSYAAKAADIINEPKKSEDISSKIIEEQKQNLHQQQKDLEYANQYIEWISNMLKQKMRDNGQPDTIPEYRNSGLRYSEGAPQNHSLIQNENLNNSIYKALPNLSNVGEQNNERLVESVNMIKELLNSNKQLRDVIDLKNRQIDNYQTDLESLQNENQELRDKIDLISRMIDQEQVYKRYNENIFREDPIGNIRNNEPQSNNSMIEELNQLRNQNTLLEQQINYLQRQQGKPPFSKTNNQINSNPNSYLTNTIGLNNNPTDAFNQKFQRNLNSNEYFPPTGSKEEELRTINELLDDKLQNKLNY